MFPYVPAGLNIYQYKDVSKRNSLMNCSGFVRLRPDVPELKLSQRLNLRSNKQKLRQKTPISPYVPAGLNIYQYKDVS